MSGVTPLIVVRRRRPLPLTSVLPQTIADIAVICGSLCSARASSSVSGRTEVGMPVGAGPEVIPVIGPGTYLMTPSQPPPAGAKKNFFPWGAEKKKAKPGHPKGCQDCCERCGKTGPPATEETPPEVIEKEITQELKDNQRRQQ